MSLNKNAMINKHFSKCEKLAFTLLAHTSSIKPKEWILNSADGVFDDLFEFSFHARRLIELSDVGKSDVLSKQNYFASTGVADATEYKYVDILNYLIHAQSFSIHIAEWKGKKVWQNSQQDAIISHIKVKTDWKEEKIFYIFPLVNHFLSEIRHQLKPFLQ